MHGSVVENGISDIDRAVKGGEWLRVSCDVSVTRERNSIFEPGFSCMRAMSCRELVDESVRTRTGNITDVEDANAMRGFNSCHHECRSALGTG